MKRLKEIIERFIPRYALLPLVLCPIVNLVAFWGSRLFLDPNRYMELGLPIDNMIPFMPEWISVYILAFVFWIVNFWLIARESREKCGVLFGEYISKLVCMVFFILMPTTIYRPKLHGGGIWIWLTRFIYAFDLPDNLFPSIHCLDSWFCWRGLFGAKKVGGWYKAFSLVFAIAVFASTVLVKQHYVADIIGAVIVAEVGLFAAKKLRLGERYAAWCDRHNMPEQSR